MLLFAGAWEVANPFFGTKNFSYYICYEYIGRKYNKTLWHLKSRDRQTMITCKVEFWYFKSLCNWDTVSNKTYQNFRDKRLVRPGSKCPNWQRSQPISYKAKFSQRYNIYLVDLKCNITYQNIREKTKVRPIFIPWNA